MLVSSSAAVLSLFCAAGLAGEAAFLDFAGDAFAAAFLLVLLPFTGLTLSASFSTSSAALTCALAFPLVALFFGEGLGDAFAGVAGFLALVRFCSFTTAFFIGVTLTTGFRLSFPVLSSSSTFFFVLIGATTATGLGDVCTRTGETGTTSSGARRPLLLPVFVLMGVFFLGEAFFTAPLLPLLATGECTSVGERDVVATTGETGFASGVTTRVFLAG